MKNIFPKDIQRPQRHEEPADAHPQPVGKRSDGERDDEDGRDTRDEDDEALGRQQVEEQPEHPGPEARGRRAEVGQPVRDQREDDGDEEEVGEPDEEVGEREGQGAVEAVCALFAEGREVFERGGDVRDGHEAVGWGERGSDDDEDDDDDDMFDAWRVWKGLVDGCLVGWGRVAVQYVPHECTAEEDGVDEGLDGALVGGKAKPHRSHLFEVNYQAL